MANEHTPPLDPELAAFIPDLPPGDLSDPVRARANMRDLVDQLRGMDGNLPGDERVTVVNRTIPGPRGPVPVRLYHPAGDALVNGPLLVYFHGGAFMVGDLDSDHHRCLRFVAEAGVSVVSVDYRLAPENPFPAGFDDCYAATLWAAENAIDLGCDPARIAVGGGSAGGGLAAAVALKARDDGPALVFQMLLYPVLDDRMRTDSMRAFTDRRLFNRADAELMWKFYLKGAAATPYAAPARASDLAGLPPAYVLACEVDPLRDENIEYAYRLIRAGVPTELHHVPGVYHGFDGIASAAVARQAFQRQLEVLKSHL